MWTVILLDEVDDWFVALAKDGARTAEQVAAAIDKLEADGPTLGRPLVGRIKGSKLHALKELRPGSARATEVRILFVFDSQRQAILLVAGDKSGRWKHCRVRGGLMARTWQKVRADVADQLDEQRVSDARTALDDAVRAHRLADVRKAQGATQKDVAAAMNVSQVRVSKIERGELRRAELGTLESYVEALGGKLRVVADFGDQKIIVE